MSLLSQSVLAVDVDFKNRCLMSLVNSAISIINEDPQTANHGERVILSQKIIRAPELMRDSLINGICATDTITSESLDPDINNRIASIFTAYSLALNNPNILP